MKALFLVIALAACGASARETVIRDTYAVATTATTQLEVFSRDHEAKIVAGAKDRADGEAKLSAWRAQVAKVELARAAVYRAISAAAALNSDQSTAALLAAALLLHQELHDLGVTP